MKQKIERLSKGIFEYEQPLLLLSAEKLTISAEAEKVYRGSFTISNTAEAHMRGIVYSSSRLVTLDTDRFSDTEKKVNFWFHADKVDAGEIITGEIIVISDCGEATLPFEATVSVPVQITSMGAVKDLFQFANLAKINPKEAVELFVSDEFRRMLSYADKKVLNLYKSLLKSSSAEQALEEFLISIHKKTAVLLSVDKEKLEYNAGKYSFIDKIVLSKSTWGYLDCKVYSNADFIKPDKYHIVADDFQNGKCEISFVINPEKMSKGRNCTELIIETAYNKIIINVSCNCNRNNTDNFFEEQRVSLAKRKRCCEFELAKLHFQYVFNKLTAAKYVSGADLIFQKYDLPESLIIELFRIYLKQLSGKAANISDAVAKIKLSYKIEKDKNPLEYALLLYLEAEKDKHGRIAPMVCDEIRALRNISDDFRILGLLLTADRRYEYNRQQAFNDIKELAVSGCNSPFMYYEALKAATAEPVCFKEYGPFEHRIVNFGIKYDCITKEVALQYSYLAGKEKEYNKRVYDILVKLYDKFKLEETATAICTSLVTAFGDGMITAGEMKKRAAEYHRWFELAINQGLKVNEVFEYYIMTMEHDYDKMIAPAAVAYFTYESGISGTDKAFLYADIARHPEYYPGDSRNYEDKIKAFVQEELKNGKIDRNLALLYDMYIPSMKLDYELAEQIAEVAFKYELVCMNSSMRAVSVAHKELDREEIIPLQGGKAYIDIFTENAEVALIGKDDRRYVASVDYSLKKLLHLEGILEDCFSCGAADRKLVLNLSEKYQYYRSFDDMAIELRKKATSIEGINPEYVKDYIQSLIYYYYENYEGEILERYLMKIDLKTLSHKDRVKIVEFMIIRDLYNVALQALCEYGFEGIDVKRIMKLCMRLLSNSGSMEKVDVLVEACHVAFSAGKYDETMVRYLVDYYNGTTIELYDLWKVAKNEGIDTFELEERFLSQQLFTETRIGNSKAVFSSYYGKALSGRIVEAYLSYYAYKYLLYDRQLDEELFEIIKKEAENIKNDVCLLALLKWYSKKETLTDAEISLIDYRMHNFEKKGIVLPFFRNFHSSMRISEQIYDRHYIQYITDPKSKVTIHYSYDGVEGGKYISEEMRNVCYGIFVKDFILFCNETLQYYITEENEGQISITESSEVTLMPEETGNGDSKYHQLNLIITAREMQEERTVIKLLESYIKTDYAISELFKPL